MNNQPLNYHEGDARAPIREEVWLLGQPPLQEYLDFIHDRAMTPSDPRLLWDEWRRANDYYHELEIAEAGAADEIECRDLDPAMAGLADQLQANDRFRHAFDTLPTTFGMLELDRLVVYQPHVTRQFVDALQARLGPEPSPQALFQFCLPTTKPQADVRVQRAGSRRYIFSSESTDFRFREAVVLKPEQIGGVADLGAASDILGLMIGFGSNFLNVVRSDNRFVLHNGYHRACALRALGIKYAPCIIQTVTRKDELAVAASDTVFDRAAFYFKAARPPLLKDFFDPKIRKVVPVKRARQVVEVSFEVREFKLEE
jgi:hypothetical protein